MFKKILSVFGSKNTNQDNAIPQEDEINRAILAHKKRLNHLREQQALRGIDTPLGMLSEIEDITQTIANLEASVQEPSKYSPPKTPDTIELLQQSAEKTLDDFRGTLDTITNELNFMPEETQAAASRLIDESKKEMLSSQEEWNKICQQPAREEILQAFIMRVELAKVELSHLERRAIYRRNLGTLETQLALKQSALTKDELESILQPQIDSHLKSIMAIEEQNNLDENRQRTLAIYQNNLKICQEMLSGKRLYAPLHLINEIDSQKQAIQDIDNQLAK